MDEGTPLFNKLGAVVGMVISVKTEAKKQIIQAVNAEAIAKLIEASAE